jgi:hypothetical protein
LTYSALFALASVVTRHAVVVGLMYVLIWEGLLGGLLDGIRWLSVTAWSAAITDEITGGTGAGRETGRDVRHHGRGRGHHRGHLPGQPQVAGLQPHR